MNKSLCFLLVSSLFSLPCYSTEINDNNINYQKENLEYSQNTNKEETSHSILLKDFKNKDSAYSISYTGLSDITYVSSKIIRVKNLIIKNESGTIKVNGIINRDKLENKEYKDVFDMLLKSDYLNLIIDGIGVYKGQKYTQHIQLNKDGNVLNIDKINLKINESDSIYFVGNVTLDNPYLVKNGKLKYVLKSDNDFSNFLKKLFSINNNEGYTEIKELSIKDIFNKL